MLDWFPFLTWIAPISSAILLALLWMEGEVRRRTGLLVLLVFVVAVYCQFFASSAVVSAVGLCVQTVLAVGLLLRWKASG